MRARDRMTTVLASVILGASVAAASPAAAHDDSTTLIVNSTDGVITATDALPPDVETSSVSGAEAASASLPGAEHIALLALAALSIGAAVVTIATGKRRVLERSG